jgi:hypothetical protein
MAMNRPRFLNDLILAALLFLGAYERMSKPSDLELLLTGRFARGECERKGPAQTLERKDPNGVEAGEDEEVHDSILEVDIDI